MKVVYRNSHKGDRVCIALPHLKQVTALAKLSPKAKHVLRGAALGALQGATGITLGAIIGGINGYQHFVDLENSKQSSTNPNS
jgi:hypothetical protein